MSMLDQLLDMGFERSLAENALKSTNEAGIEQAMDWLMKEQEKKVSAPIGDVQPADQQNGGDVVMTAVDDVSVTESPAADDTTTNEPLSTCEIVEDEVAAAEPTADDAAAVKSLKCLQCGVLLSDMSKVMVHGERTGHDQYDETTESAPVVSEEERQRKVLDLRDRIAAAKQKKEADERQKAKDMEKRRRMDGQALADFKQRKEEEEMKKIVEERKRAKIEEKVAKERVLEQIKRDKEKRRLEAEAASSNAAGLPADKISPVKTQPHKPAVVHAPKDYDQCRLQFRLPSGKTIQQAFGAKESLSAARVFVQMNAAEELGEDFRMLTTFPRKEFSSVDMEAPLNHLGLTLSLRSLSSFFSNYHNVSKFVRQGVY